MKLNILTLFPELFEPFLQTSIIGEAHAKKILETTMYQIRDYATDKHKTVDDTPYGGGPGMVMKVEPIDLALRMINKKTPRERQRVIVMSARGRIFTQAIAQELAASGQDLTLICGRYEGIDQRVADHLSDGELAIGPYVLAGGEVAAMVVIEAVARLLPGVLGNPESLTEESFTNAASCNLKPINSQEYPQYTKPETYNGWEVPKVLLSGNHAAIAAWRREHQRLS